MTLKKGMNQESVQELNRALVIRLLREQDGCSRAELARQSRLKPSTITNIINEFQQYGLVREEGIIKEGRGRSAIGISLNADAYKVVGIRLSRKYFLIGLFDIRGQEILSSKHKITKSDSPRTAFEMIKTQIQKLITECESGRVIAIGCAIPGPFLRKEGQEALSAEFPDWKEIQIKQELEAQFHMPVYLEHDANVGAISQYWRMCPGENKTLVYISAGQGVGGGIVNEGTLFLGALGAAGEIGHMCIDYEGPYCFCGNKGCLENYCSSTALIRQIETGLTDGNYSVLQPGCDFNDILKAAREGDKFVLEEYKKACEFLAVGLISIVNVLNPDIIVVGDEMSRIDPELMLEVLKSRVKERVLPVIWEHLNIRICDRDRDAILGGAALIAIEGVLKHPEFIKSQWED